MAEGLVRRLGRMCGWIATVALWVATAALVGAVAINFANVVGRYAFLRPIEWAEEVMLYLMIAAVFLAVPAVTWRGRHIRMDMLVTALEKRQQQAVAAMVQVLLIALSLQMLRAGWPVVSLMATFGQRSEAAHVPMWLVHGFIQFGFALIGIFAAVRLAEILLGIAQSSRPMHEEALDEAR